MKKSVGIVVIIFALLISMQVSAASMRAVGIWPELSFSGTIANCAVWVSSDAGDQVSATIRLMQGSKNVKTWYGSGTGSLTFEKSTVVEKGKTYTLAVDVTINGIDKPTVSISNECK